MVEMDCLQFTVSESSDQVAAPRPEVSAGLDQVILQVAANQISGS